jgi:translation initiation factor 2B subunit (eIF-2B alpha/beta/delta family)
MAASTPGQPQYTVNVGSLREQLAEHIKGAEQVVAAGVNAVQRATDAGDSDRAAQLKGTLASARRTLKSLQSAQLSMESACCDQESMNCEFFF